MRLWTVTTAAVPSAVCTTAVPCTWSLLLGAAGRERPQGRVRFGDVWLRLAARSRRALFSAVVSQPASARAASAASASLTRRPR